MGIGDEPVDTGAAGRGGAAAMALFNPATLLAIADSLPIMIGYVDCDERYVFLNRPMADWFERPRSEVLGRRVAELMDADTYAARREQLKAALAGEAQRFKAVYEHPTRGRLMTQVEYAPHGGADGKVAGLVLVIQDITEQHAAEEALHESEARFRRISDFAPVLMWVTRADGSRDFVNRAYAEFAGLSIEQARDHDWREWIHPDDIARLAADSANGEASLQPFALEGRFRRHDGEWRWLRSVSSPRLDADGGVIGFIGAASDVTLAKEAELELRRQVEQRTRALANSERRFRAIFNSVQEVMALLDRDGNVLEVNRTATPWREVNPHDAIGKPLWEAPSLAAYPGHEALIRAAIASAAAGEAFAQEVRLEGNAKLGAPSAVLDVSMQPVRGEGGDIDYLLFEARDVTELKQAQEQLRQSQKMEALGQLTGGIAHDFNNLLTVVVGGLDLITKKIEDEKLLRYANNALSAAERGVRLTGQLLTFSRSQRLEVRPCHVAPIIEAMRPLLRNVLGPGIEKHFEFDDLSMPVMGDPTQIEVALLNLAINARDAMPRGGKLVFSSRKVTVGEDPELDPGDYLELAVRDTGTGMSSAVMARALEPFFTTKDVGKGTGLGLSMVYGMARQSGGTARIASEAGNGTTVSLFFRKAEAAGDAALSGEAAHIVPLKPNAASVVVIDDDPDVRKFLVTSLEEMGYQVSQASDGPGGIALVESEQPDVVVIDYVMPGMSGAEAAAIILKARPEQPILFVSGYNETDDIRSAAPNAMLLSKPFRPDALDAAVRNAIAGLNVATPLTLEKTP